MRTSWSKRTRRLLEDLDVAFEFVYADLLEGEEKQAVKAELAKHNPLESFPTLVIDVERSIVGFKPDEIRRALER